MKCKHKKTVEVKQTVGVYIHILYSSIHMFTYVVHATAQDEKRFS